MNLPPGRYATCPTCHGAPLQTSWEAKPDRVVTRVSLCGWCNGVGLVRLPETEPPTDCHSIRED